MAKDDNLRNGSYREAVLQYVKKKYKTEADYPWARDPKSAVLRHGDNRKWFGLVMEVEKSRLGLSGKELVDVVNVKTSDSMFHDMLLGQKGYLPGYHMNKQSWMTLLLDGTVPFEDICGMIDASYKATASKDNRTKIRPPKEWIIPANPKYYDIEQAFREAEEIDWKQGSGIKAGDTVYIYMAAPVSAILYQCKVTQIDIPCDYQDENLTIRKMMRIKLQKRYASEAFPFEMLKNEYGIFAVRGPRGIPENLSAALRNSAG